MSGTSLDGIDVAILKTDGERILEFGNSTSYAYAKRHKTKLQKATRAALKWAFIGKQPGRLSTAEELIDKLHILAAEHIIADNPCDIIGYHGQTVLHRPPQNGVIGKTLQLGQGQKLADALGVPCVFDFRSADVAAGGEGAPLAPIYHKALCEFSGLKGNIVVLNLGGVGNFTLVSKDGMKASDTGPANGPLDSWMNQHGYDFDKDGMFSSKGKVDLALIESWLRNIEFFRSSGPKSADRYDFDVVEDIEDMSIEDGAATLSLFCVASVQHTLLKLDLKPDQLIVCGGGRNNKFIMKMLSKMMTFPVRTAEDAGWMGDDIEAQAIAYFAVRTKLGLPISFPETTGVSKPIMGGVIAQPMKN